MVRVGYVRSVTPPCGWRPRLVALDIDGTLCAADGPGAEIVRPAVRDAIDAARAGGAQVVLCSGRSLLAVRRFVDVLGGWAGMAICSNGAVWLDAATGVVLQQRMFELARCAAALRDLLPGAVFAAEEVGLGNRATGVLGDLPFVGRNRLVDFAELVATPTSRLTVSWPGRSAVELAQVLAVARRAAELAEALADAHYSIGQPDAWLFGAPAGVTKGSALEELRGQLGVLAADTLAIGDGANDVEMLAWAAHGVAMGQSSRAVRAVADEVTASVHEDGAAVALNRWFGSGTDQGRSQGDD